MALRLDRAVVKGELNNRERGRVHGTIWLAGREEPLSLELSGNCLRDLAGGIVRFENARASAAPGERSALIASEQTGVVGDITASRKVRVFDVPMEDALRIAKAGGTPPEHMANALYIEWFSGANGRVVIESTDYKVDILPPQWTLSPEDEQNQIAATHQAIRDWLERLDEERHSSEAPAYDPEEDERLDEFGYEKFLRESDARTDKYMELLEKYEGHPDRQKIVAREMGWEWLEEALEADERGALPPREQTEVPEIEPNPLTEGVDWVRDEDGHIHHPLTKRMFESGVAIYHYCNDRGLMGENADDDLTEMIFEFQTAGAKVAGALDGLGYDDEDDARAAGLVVASLKRALNYLHTSMGAAEKVAQKESIDAERLTEFRKEQFEAREEILTLMQRFREKG